MRKVNTLKYLILTFVMTMSFFMFSRVSVAAVETVVIEKNWSFELEAVDSGDLAKGYVITGVVDSCEGVDGECDSIASLTELVVPDFYNGYPIVGIGEGNVDVDTETAIKTFKGTFDKLKNVAINKIVLGSNIETIGVCAFCNLNFNEIVVSSSVANIGDYAFANSSVVKVLINRYQSLENVPYTDITRYSFSDVNNLKYIVFSSHVVYGEYYNKANVWKDLSENTKQMFTYEIIYNYYNKEILQGQKIYFYGFPLEDLWEDLENVGFDFLGWFYSSNDSKVSASDYPSGSEKDGKMVNNLKAKWQLTAPKLSMKTYVDEVQDEDHKVEYSGKNTKLDIKVFIDEVAEGLNVEDYVISYAWSVAYSDGSTSSLNNNSDSHSITFVRQSGIYICTVTFSYGGVSESYDVSIQNDKGENVEIAVLPRPLVIDIGDRTVEYGKYVEVSGFNLFGDGPDAIGEKIKSFISMGYTASDSDIPVGRYKDVLTIEIMNIGYEDGSANYVDNYDITCIPGDLIVEPKTLRVGLLLNDNEIEYGDDENLVATAGYTVYKDESKGLEGFNKTLNFTYEREKSNEHDVGEYKIIGVIVDDPNFVVELDSSDYKYVIKPKKVNVVWEKEESFVYDGNVKEVNAYYNDISDKRIDLNISFTKDEVDAELINAGTYKAIVDISSVDENYELLNVDNEIKINKAESVFEGTKNEIVTYNGLPQMIEVGLNHTESEVSLSYVSSECKGATTAGNPCKILAEVEESENYKANSQIFNLHIRKYELIVEPDMIEIVYGNMDLATYLTKEYEGVNKEKVKVRFEKDFINAGVSVGYYDITGVNVTGDSIYNYSVKLAENSGFNKIKVVPAPVEINFYFYENLVYDGTIKDIGVKVAGTKENVGLQVSYEGNKVPKNAGNYRLNASINNDNFYITGKDYLEFSIAKANYDVSNIKLNSKEVNFNFKGHSIVLEGDLPEGVTAVYSIDGKEGNGTVLPFKHIIKVSFEGDFDNYNYIEPLEAVLNISMTWVWIVLAVTIVLVSGVVILFIYLVKFNKIHFRKRIKSKVFRKIIKKNKELEQINYLIASSRVEKDESEELSIIEEPVKFVKTEPIKVNTEIISKSFVDELFKASPIIKQYYSEMKNELLSYVGISSKIKRDYETFYLDNAPIARMNIEEGRLFAYYALDPSMYKKEEYKHQDVGKKKEFGAVPLKLCVNSLESLRHAKMFVRIIRKRENIKSVSNFVRMDYAKVYTIKDNSFKVFKKVFVRKSKNKEEQE